MKVSTLILAPVVVAPVLAQGFDSGNNAGLRNPGNRHYFRFDTPWYNDGTKDVQFRVNGELMGNNSYVSGEYQAWLNTITSCTINGQGIIGAWRAICARNLISKAVVSAMQNLVENPDYVNPANMRLAYGGNTNEATYVTADAGQGQSCDLNYEKPVGSCAGVSRPGGYISRGEIDYQMDTSAAGRRKIKVTCKKACGYAGGFPNDLVESLVKNNLVPLINNNGAMGAGFGFSRSDNTKIFARCRLTLAGEVWYDRVTGCPDLVEGSSEKTGQW